MPLQAFVFGFARSRCTRLCDVVSNLVDVRTIAKRLASRVHVRNTRSQRAISRLARPKPVCSTKMVPVDGSTARLEYVMSPVPGNPPAN